MWHSLSNKLNAAGPPVKSETAWKKVWVNLTYNTKKKLSNMKTAIHGSGGVPYNVINLTDSEEDIASITALNATVSGYADSNVFGAKIISISNATSKVTVPSTSNAAIK